MGGAREDENEQRLDSNQLNHSLLFSLFLIDVLIHFLHVCKCFLKKGEVFVFVYSVLEGLL